MTRPKKPRYIRFRSGVSYFKPRGTPLRNLDEVVLMHDEIEALRLHDVKGLDHIEAAKRMKISQPTFGRILDGAYKKVADALVNVKAIRVEE